MDRSRRRFEEACLSRTRRRGLPRAQLQHLQQARVLRPQPCQLRTHGRGNLSHAHTICSTRPHCGVRSSAFPVSWLADRPTMNFGRPYRRTSNDEEVDATQRIATPAPRRVPVADRRFSSIVPSIRGRMAPWTMPTAGRSCPHAGPASRRPCRASLSHLAGPPGGVVELPHDLAWSGRRSFDLANPVQRYMYHMTVLTSGVTREHYTSWLNVDLLRSEWTSLGLPLPLRRVWEGHFP